jgi:hypothetical protein
MADEQTIKGLERKMGPPLGAPTSLLTRARVSLR